MDYIEQYGPWALIVGGSEGIGAAIAHQLAEKGLNIFLVARTKERLDKLADEVRASNPDREVRSLATDMSVVEGSDAVLEVIKDLEIGMLVYNAGACTEYHNFHDINVEFNLKLTTLNVINKMRLVHALGEKMRQRKRGGIILMGSTAAVAGLPGFSTYSACKAFSSLFSEGLWHELRPYNVHLLGFVVAETATPAIIRNYPGRKGSGANPADVARQALNNIANGPIAYAENGVARLRRWPAFHATSR